MKTAGAERADAQKQEKVAWILRVLGVQISPVADDSSAQAAEDIVGIWWDAKDSINEQIEALRHAILNTGHPLAARACENGLAGFSGGVLVRFQASVVECRNAVPDAAVQARQNMEKYAAALTKYVSYNPVLALLEKNPFGIQLTIRQDVTRAVNAILQHAKS